MISLVISALKASRHPLNVIDEPGSLTVMVDALKVALIRIGGAGLIYVSHVILARLLGVYEYGVFAYLWVWVIVLGSLTSVGLSSATVKLVPVYIVAKKWRRIAGMVRQSRLVTMLVGLCLSLLTLAVVLVYFGGLNNRYMWPLMIALVCVPILGLSDVQEGLARSFRWVEIAFLPGYVLRPALLIVLIIAALAMGFQSSAETAMVTALISSCVVLAVQAKLIQYWLKPVMKNIRPINHVKSWIFFAFPYFLLNIFYLTLANVDVIILGLTLGPESVALYYAAVKSSYLISYIYFAASAGASPRFSALHAQDSKIEMIELYYNITNFTFWPSLIFAACLSLYGLQVLAFFGQEYVASYPILIVLIVAAVIKAAIGPVDFLLNMTGHQNACAKILGVAAVASIGTNIVLISAFGLMGAAVATGGVTVLCTLWLALYAKKWVGVNAFQSLVHTKNLARFLEGIPNGRAKKK